MKINRLQSGFTLIELMVVVIIIAALAGMVLPLVLPASDAAKRKIAMADIASITVALQLYRLHNDRYPSSDEGLAALNKPSPEYGGEPFLDKDNDPWKRKYVYKYRGSHNTMRFDLWSLGPDGKEGTEDDITNWEE